MVNEMSQAIISESNLTAIADAIRAKNGSSATYTPAQMATAIAALPVGGSSNVVIGTFTTSSTEGAAQSVTIPYTGSGYPIAAIVYVNGGVYNNTSSGNTTWYNSTQRYAVGQWTLTKSVESETPTWTTSGAANQGVTTAIYKNSTSSSTSYTRTSSMNINIYSSSNANSTATSVVRFKSSKSMSVFVASTSYGLLAECEYKYIIIYSS